MTAKEISQHLGANRVTIWRRAKKEDWPFTIKRGKGGAFHDFHISSLPEDIRKRLRSREAIADKTLAWFERFMDRPRVERVQVYVLCVIFGFFLGYFYFRFQ